MACKPVTLVAGEATATRPPVRIGWLLTILAFTIYAVRVVGVGEVFTALCTEAVLWKMNVKGSNKIMLVHDTPQS
jgi:hypothetical protein